MRPKRGMWHSERSGRAIENDGGRDLAALYEGQHGKREPHSGVRSYGPAAARRAGACAVCRAASRLAAASRVWTATMSREGRRFDTSDGSEVEIRRLTKYRRRWFHGTT